MAKVKKVTPDGTALEQVEPGDTPVVDAPLAGAETDTEGVIRDASDSVTQAESARDSLMTSKIVDTLQTAPVIAVPRRNPWPPVVTLCGSMKKSGDKMQQVAMRLTIAGVVILLPNVDMRKAHSDMGLFMVDSECVSCHGKSGLMQICTLCGHTGRVKTIDEVAMNAVKAKLDELHLRKIEMGDVAYFVNVDGYYGESTTREIKHAVSLKKPLSFLDVSKNPTWVLDLLHENTYKPNKTVYGDEAWYPLTEVDRVSSQYPQIEDGRQ